MYESNNKTHAIIQNIPSTWKLFGLTNSGAFNFQEAQREHTDFVRVLKTALPQRVKQFSEDITEDKACCIENVVLIYYGTAILTKPRTKYSDSFLSILQSFSLVIVEVPNPVIIKLNGSDVLFTGNEFFIGISETTNYLGASFFARVYPDYPVTPIPLQTKGSLKSYVSMAGPGIICHSEHEESKRIVETIFNITCYTYDIVVLTEQRAAQILYANGTLIHRAFDEIPKSEKGIRNLRKTLNTESVKFAVLGNSTDTQFSSFCLLFEHPKDIKAV